MLANVETLPIPAHLEALIGSRLGADHIEFLWLPRVTVKLAKIDAELFLCGGVNIPNFKILMVGHKFGAISFPVMKLGGGPKRGAAHPPT
jgi:hypothetical protein